MDDDTNCAVSFAGRIPINAESTLRRNE